MTKQVGSQIPGPTGSWLFGNLTEFRAGMLGFLGRLPQEYGAVARFRLGTRRLIMINDPALIEEVLVTKNRSFRKHYATRLLRPVLGNGLLLNEGQSWLRQRRLIQPAFCRRFTGEFAAIVRSQTAALATQWQSQPQRDLYRDMTALTVRIAAKAFLGIRDRCETHQLSEWLEVIHADFEHRFLTPWNLPVWLPTTRNRRLRTAVEQLSHFIDRVILSRRGDAEEKHDALSLLLRAEDEQGQRMSSKLLRDEVMTLLLAGHDTTANSLTWSWVLLAQHPEVMRQLAVEGAMRSARDDSTSPTSDPPPMARCVIRESMRLYPPAYMIGRETRHDVRIGEYWVRKGTSVVMSPWVMHRDERFFSEPDRFRPERWTNAFERKLPRYAYFPFGGGPRVCIGRDLALIESTLILSLLAPRFVVTLNDPIEVVPWPTVTLRVRDAVPARVTSRQPNGQPQPLVHAAVSCPHQDLGTPGEIG